MLWCAGSVRATAVSVRRALAHLDSYHVPMAIPRKTTSRTARVIIAHVCHEKKDAALRSKTVSSARVDDTY